VTMLQRSPTYVISKPEQDRIANFLRRIMPAMWAYRLSRWKNVSFMTYIYQLSQLFPNFVKKRLIRKARKRLGTDFDVDTHFTPRYRPWEQRMCLIPDADMFVAIKSGRASVVFVPDAGRPNGIAFSPDEKKLYVIVMAFPGNRPAEIRVFDVNGDKLSNNKLFSADFAKGSTDGMRVDMDGNVWCIMGNGDPAEDGVRCHAPNGDLIGKIHLPETCANLCFGGKKKNRLFMTASTSVYSVYVETVGAMVP